MKDLLLSLTVFQVWSWVAGAGIHRLASRSHKFLHYFGYSCIDFDPDLWCSVGSAQACDPRLGAANDDGDDDVGSVLLGFPCIYHSIG